MCQKEISGTPGEADILRVIWENDNIIRHNE
jgi:hypothetical protein